MGSGNIHNYGDRNPAVWVAGKEQKIVVSSGVNGNANFLVFSEKKYPLNTWITIKISQRLVGDKFAFEAVIAGDTVISQTNDLPTELKDVKVFGGNPWYPSQEGKIKNLVLKTENDGVCVCNARQDTCGKAGAPCKEDGKIYSSGEIMSTEDRCNTCSCKNGKRICLRDCNSISLPTTTKPIPPVPAESSCVWSVDCYDKTKRRLCSGPWHDAPCKCIFGKCRFTTDVAYRDGCTTYKDCDCKHNRDTCFCVGGTCNLRGPWECHQHPGERYSEDCRNIKKCDGIRCYCNDGACEKLDDNSTAPAPVGACDQPKALTEMCMCTRSNPSGCKPISGRWTFDKKSNQCEEFGYTGCGGNDNNFPSKAECVTKCGAKKVRKEGEMCGTAGERWDELPVNYGECAEGLTCVGNRGNVPGVCRKFGRGYLPPEKCNDSCKRKIKSPVCGEDGKEYNDCTVKCAGVKVKCLGKCPCEGRKEGDACGRWTVSYGECAEGLTCVSNNTIAPGFCKKPGCHQCNEKFHQPICGTDGRQYGNLCLANCKGVAVQCNGECPCDKKERILKDCTDKKWGEWCALCKNKTLACDGWCIHPPRPRTPNIYCQPQLDDCIGKKEGDNCTLCPQKISECSGECQMRTGTEPPISIVWCMPRKKGCSCPDIYQPVCGTDGRKYDNQCLAKCEGVAVGCYGECPCRDEYKKTCNMYGPPCYPGMVCLNGVCVKPGSYKGNGNNMINNLYIDGKKMWGK